MLLRHSLLVFPMGAEFCAALNIHRSHTQFWQTSMESWWLPQAPELLHWSAAVTPERSSFGSHLIWEELKEGQDGPAKAFWVIPGLVGEQEKGFYTWYNWYLSQAPLVVTPSLILTEGMWMYNTYILCSCTGCSKIVCPFSPLLKGRPDHFIAAVWNHVFDSHSGCSIEKSYRNSSENWANVRTIKLISCSYFLDVEKCRSPHTVFGLFYSADV